MVLVSIFGWIVLGLAGLYGLLFLLNRNPDGGVRWMMHVQGWTLLLSAAIIAFLPISQFFVLLAVPVSFFLPMALMGRRVAASGRHIEKMLSESQRTGVPIGDLLKEDFRSRGVQEEEVGSPLIDAAFGGKLDVVEHLVQEGADVNAPGKKQGGWTALHFAASANHREIAKCLIEHGANINAQGSDGESPLGRAAVHGDLEMVTYLVENGANVNLVNDLGWTPLRHAVHNKHVAVAKYLRAHGGHE